MASTGNGVQGTEGTGEQKLREELGQSPQDAFVYE